MHPQLAVSAVSSWRWTLDEDLAFWWEAGIDQVGLSFRKLEEAGLDTAITRVLDAGLRVTNIVELGWWDLTAPTSWPAQQVRLLEAIAAAEALGGCLVLTTGPAGDLQWDDAADALGAALEPVLRAARAVSVPVTIEHTSPLRLDLSFCTTARDGMDLARRVGTGLCLEVNSCFAERDLPTTIVGANDVLAHVQLSDFVIGSLSTPDRAVPGDGDIPLGSIIGVVLASGYRGAFELEMVGPRIEDEGYEMAIRRGVAYLDALLAEVGGQSSA
jgi:sugar phosphate isomerase/epimerase